MSKIVESFQADLPTRIFRVTNCFNESVYLAANEPSLGMYRLQEHVQTTVPRVVMQKQSLYGIFQQVEGACYDLDYARETLKDVASVSNFVRVAQLLDSAVQLKKQLDEQQQQRASLQVAEEASSSTNLFSISGQTRDSLDITPKSFD